MRFIRAIRIRDFRSLPSVDLTDLDNVVPIVGPNGSGKSNLLRALNLFFNDEVEIASIRFRYISNHVHPTDLLKACSAASVRAHRSLRTKSRRSTTLRSRSCSRSLRNSQVRQQEFPR